MQKFNLKKKEKGKEEPPKKPDQKGFIDTDTAKDKIKKNSGKTQTVKPVPNSNQDKKKPFQRGKKY